MIFGIVGNLFRDKISKALVGSLTVLSERVGTPHKTVVVENNVGET